MSDTVFHSTTFASSAGSRIRRFAERLERIFDHAMMASSTHDTLQALPDGVLRDMGLARSEIPFVAGALAARHSRHVRYTSRPQATRHNAP